MICRIRTKHSKSVHNAGEKIRNIQARICLRIRGKKCILKKQRKI